MLEQVIGIMVYVWSFLIVVLGLAVFFKKKKHGLLKMIICITFSIFILLFRNEIIKMLTQ